MVSRFVRDLQADPSSVIQQGVDAAQAVDWLKHCDEVLTSEPAKGLIYARTAVRLTLRVRVRCVHVRAVGTLAHAHRALVHFDSAERLFRSAFEIADGCRCRYCFSDLSRKMAYLYVAQGRFDAALTHANSALNSYGVDDPCGRGKAFLCRGAVHFDRTFYEAAVSDFENALELLPPAVQFHPIALHSYAFSLVFSEDPSHLEDAERLLPQLERRYGNLRGMSVERAKLIWLKAGVYARQSRVKPDLNPWQRRGLQGEARKLLRQAGRKLEKHGMLFEVAGVAADLAALEATRDRYAVANLLEEILFPQELRPHVDAVLETITERRPLEAFWAALEALRDATVAQGCAPPLVFYGHSYPV